MQTSNEIQSVTDTPRRRPGSRLLVIALIATMIGGFFLLDYAPEPILSWKRYLQWDYLKANRDHLQLQVEDHLLEALLIYFIVYVVITAVSFPGALVMTLIGGLIFGRWLGVVVVSFASTTGATLAFVTTRYLFRDWIEHRWGPRLQTIHRGIDKDGAWYLLTLRLVPLFPFFLVNAAMGLTPIRVKTYWWVSQLGMLPATFIYVNAGTALGEIDSPGDVLSLPVLGALALLGIVPLLLRWIISRWSRPAVSP